MIEENSQSQLENITKENNFPHNPEFKISIENEEYTIKFTKPPDNENNLMIILVENNYSFCEYYQAIYSIEKLISSCSVFQLFEKNIDKIIEYICQNFEENNLISICKNSSQFILNIKLNKEEEQILSINLDKINL